MLTLLCKRIFPDSSSSSSISDNNLNPKRTRYRNLTSIDSGLKLIIGDFRNPDNILESNSLKRITSTEGNNNNNKRSFLINSGGGFCSSCTESLGFESSDQMENEEDDGGGGGSNELVNEKEMLLNVESRWKRLREDRIKRRNELLKMKIINNDCPPLTSLNQNGQPNFFLKPVRKDGRLELIQVWINRPGKFLHVSRQDGRLRLNLIVPENLQEQDEEEEEIETEEIEAEVIGEEEIEEEEIEEMGNVKEMNFSLMSSGEGFRRCHELINHHYHHHHHHHHNLMTRSTVHVL